MAILDVVSNIKLRCATGIQCCDAGKSVRVRKIFTSHLHRFTNLHHGPWPTQLDIRNLSSANTTIRTTHATFSSPVDAVVVDNQRRPAPAAEECPTTC